MRPAAFDKRFLCILTQYKNGWNLISAVTFERQKVGGA
jgi:hypothetical protein